MSSIEFFAYAAFSVIKIALNGFLLSLVIVRFISPNPRRPLDSELEFILPGSRKRVKQSSILDDSTVYMSLVIPAYNEAKRLPLMLKETVDYLSKRQSKNKDFTFELIIVSDGSKDQTIEKALEFAESNKFYDLKVIQLDINRGKGGAVTQGMLAASGEYILFADADGATKISDLEKMEREAKKIQNDGLAMAVGSRAHMVKSESVVKRSFIRNLLMHGFHTIIYVLGIRNIKDTQCGFKLFSRKAARVIFPNVHVEGWIFDIETIIIANKRKVPVVEVPVSWHEVEGSKLNVIRDSVKMLIDLLIIRINYLTYSWHVFDERSLVNAKKDE